MENQYINYVYNTIKIFKNELELIDYPKFKIHFMDKNNKLIELYYCIYIINKPDINEYSLIQRNIIYIIKHYNKSKYKINIVINDKEMLKYFDIHNLNVIEIKYNNETNKQISDNDVYDNKNENEDIKIENMSDDSFADSSIKNEDIKIENIDEYETNDNEKSVGATSARNRTNEVNDENNENDDNKNENINEYETNDNENRTNEVNDDNNEDNNNKNENIDEYETNDDENRTNEVNDDNNEDDNNKNNNENENENIKINETKIKNVGATSARNKINEPDKYISNKTNSLPSQTIKFEITKSLYTNSKKVNNKFVIRDYQLNLIDKILKNNFKSDIPRFLLACGTGKTMIMKVVIYNLILQNSNVKILILVPSIELVNQFKEVFESFDEIKLSKNKIIKCSISTTAISTNNPFNGYCNTNLIVCCYNSYYKLKYTQNKNRQELTKFDYIFVDEAHHIGNKRRIKRNYEIDTTRRTEIMRMCKNVNYRAYFFSATVENPDYIYDIITSIKNNYLKPFVLDCIIIKNVEIDKTQTKILTRKRLNELIKKQEFENKLMGLEQILLNEDRYKRILIYCNRVSKTDEIINKFNGKIKRIVAETSKAERKQIFNELENQEIRGIVSVNCITEGVDIKFVDTVVFIDERKKFEDINQCIGRAIRLYPDKDLAKVVLFVKNNIDIITKQTYIFNAISAYAKDIKINISNINELIKANVINNDENDNKEIINNNDNEINKNKNENDNKENKSVGATSARNENDEDNEINKSLKISRNENKSISTTSSMNENINKDVEIEGEDIDGIIHNVPVIQDDKQIEYIKNIINNIMTNNYNKSYLNRITTDEKFEIIGEWWNKWHLLPHENCSFKMPNSNDIFPMAQVFDDIIFDEFGIDYTPGNTPINTPKKGQNEQSRLRSIIGKEAYNLYKNGYTSKAENYQSISNIFYALDKTNDENDKMIINGIEYSKIKMKKDMYKKEKFPQYIKNNARSKTVEIYKSLKLRKNQYVIVDNKLVNMIMLNDWFYNK